MVAPAGIEDVSKDRNVRLCLPSVPRPTARLDSVPTDQSNFRTRGTTSSAKLAVGLHQATQPEAIRSFAKEFIN